MPYYFRETPYRSRKDFRSSECGCTKGTPKWENTVQARQLSALTCFPFCFFFPLFPCLGFSPVFFSPSLSTTAVTLLFLYFFTLFFFWDISVIFWITWYTLISSHHFLLLPRKPWMVTVMVSQKRET